MSTKVKPGIEAVTLDFFQTLAHHRTGAGGRGRAVIDYFASRGIESRPWEHQVLYDVLEPHGREYSPGLSRVAKERYLIRLCERLFERLGVSRERHRPAVHAQRIWELIGPTSLAVYSDVVASLHDLRDAGYRLLIVSNWMCGLGHYCHELGIARHFDGILASAECGSAKPDGAIFAEAARRLGTAPDRILHVGDSVEDDLNGARAAGMHAVLLDRNGAGTSTESVVLRGLDEVLPLLERSRGVRADSAR